MTPSNRVGIRGGQDGYARRDPEDEILRRYLAVELPPGDRLLAGQ